MEEGLDQAINIQYNSAGRLEVSGHQGTLAEIRLLTPTLGEVTPPLQAFPWVGFPAPLPGKSPETLWQHLQPEYDRSLPRAVVFCWEAPILPGSTLQNDPLDEPTPQGSTRPKRITTSSLREIAPAWPALVESRRVSVRYDLEIAPLGHAGEKINLRRLSEPRAEVYNLRIGMTYLWKVTARQGRQVIAESKVGQFITDDTPPRWIRVPGTTNVRDLGGWPLPNGHRIRQGLFYRGSELNSHCRLTDEGRQVLMHELGIRTDLDLRGIGENIGPILDPNQVNYVNLPVMAYDAITRPEYIGRYRSLFNLLATRQRYPLYLHCWGGADRTGTVAYLVGALLGMNEDDLALEYELTSLSVWGERLRNSDAYIDLQQTLALFAPTGSTIQTQVLRYLRVVGVTDEEIAAIRDILTE